MSNAVHDPFAVSIDDAGRVAAVPRGFPLLYGGNRVAVVPDAVADAFRAGDQLVVAPDTGEVLHIPAGIADRVTAAVTRAREAFGTLTGVPDASIDAFYDAFARRLADDAVWAEIRAANDADVARARERGRSTTRLVATATMRARMIEGLQTPSLSEAGLPEGSVGLIDEASRAAGWALFSTPGLALAVARGSGAAVAQLGAIARQAGTPVSLHGTGGAWIVVDADAPDAWVDGAVYNSLDSKKCNTLNTLCVVASGATRTMPVALEAIRRRGIGLGHGHKVHVTTAARPFVPVDWFAMVAPIRRAEGDVPETVATAIGDASLGHEWEWEGTPEVTIHVVPDVATAVMLFNAQSPRFVAALLSPDADTQARFFRTIDAPFVSNGFTRWVDGQFALKRPELGLTNWEEGRLLARGGILTGDGVYTVRLRATQGIPDLHQ
ncbi:MAG: aldehyde dehydrogenase family protein [Proteobacteria bacterium]|nr:aldehyde dehydrogenase family protein [Pseudomonadota bacterium]